jgi:OOP family OmpA-OmpF porin
VLRDALARIHEDLRGQLEEFDGDTAPLGNLATRLEPCVQEQAQPQEKRISPWLWAVPLVLLIAAATWITLRAVEANRVDAYVQELRALPGVVVTGTERRDGKWHVSGLRDPLAADPAELLAKSGLDPERVVGHWEPYQALNPLILVRRLRSTLKPPPDVAFLIDGKANTIRALGNAPQHWVEKARTLIATLPAGSPSVDLTALKDIQDPTFINLRSALEAHVITFDSGAPRPSAGHDALLDTVADQLKALIKRARELGFSVRIMIVGHADSTGKETSNLALSAARAEVVRHMLRIRGIAPDLLSVRSAGTLEPLESGKASGQDDPMNRRVTFTVSTSD